MPRTGVETTDGNEKVKGKPPRGDKSSNGIVIISEENILCRYACSSFVADSSASRVLAGRNFYSLITGKKALQRKYFLSPGQKRASRTSLRRLRVSNCRQPSLICRLQSCLGCPSIIYPHQCCTLSSHPSLSSLPPKLLVSAPEV